MLVFDLVSKALARSKSFSLIFILNFALAIASLSYLQFFKSSMESSLESKAKVLLGADLVVSSRFAITNTQIETIKSRLPAIQDFNQGVSTVSMIASDKRARLMEVVKLVRASPTTEGLLLKTTAPTPKAKRCPKRVRCGSIKRC
ncbi:MAG: hypothetical protein U9N49_00790 [Campylobacterota bacterium]|nr:hypothetical protein [Campylobacterota bacterium]